MKVIDVNSYSISKVRLICEAGDGFHPRPVFVTEEGKILTLIIKHKPHVYGINTLNAEVRAEMLMPRAKMLTMTREESVFRMTETSLD